MFKPRTRQGHTSLGIKLIDSVLSGSRQDGRGMKEIILRRKTKIRILTLDNALIRL